MRVYPRLCYLTARYARRFVQPYPGDNRRRLPVPLAGFEPATCSVEDYCTIRCATGAYT